MVTRPSYEGFAMRSWVLDEVSKRKTSGAQDAVAHGHEGFSSQLNMRD